MCHIHIRSILKASILQLKENENGPGEAAAEEYTCVFWSQKAVGFLRCALQICASSYRTNKPQI